MLRETKKIKVYEKEVEFKRVICQTTHLQRLLKDGEGLEDQVEYLRVADESHCNHFHLKE